MIKSKLQMKSDLIKFLSNPAQAADDLKRLVEKEKTVRAQLKELYEGKTKKAFLDKAEAALKEAQGRLADAEATCSTKVRGVKKAREKALQEAEASGAKIKAAQKELEAGVAALDEASAQLDKDVKKVAKDLKVADASKVKWIELKGEYESKLKDLETRFKGLS